MRLSMITSKLLLSVMLPQDRVIFTIGLYRTARECAVLIMISL